MTFTVCIQTNENETVQGPVVVTGVSYREALEVFEALPCEAVMFSDELPTSVVRWNRQDPEFRRRDLVLGCFAPEPKWATTLEERP
jgi:hypothetical protein